MNQEKLKSLTEKAKNEMEKYLEHSPSPPRQAPKANDSVFKEKMEIFREIKERVTEPPSSIYKQMIQKQTQILKEQKNSAFKQQETRLQETHQSFKQ